MSNVIQKWPCNHISCTETQKLYFSEFWIWNAVTDQSLDSMDAKGQKTYKTNDSKGRCRLSSYLEYSAALTSYRNMKYIVHTSQHCSWLLRFDPCRHCNLAGELLAFLGLLQQLTSVVEDHGTRWTTLYPLLKKKKPSLL